jgi:hypothetical protein
VIAWPVRPLGETVHIGSWAFRTASIVRIEHFYAGRAAEAGTTQLAGVWGERAVASYSAIRRYGLRSNPNALISGGRFALR